MISCSFSKCGLLHANSAKAALLVHGAAHRPRSVANASSSSRFANENGNLGVLSAQVDQPSDNSWALQRVSPESFQNRGLYADPSTIFSSVVLLVLLLAFGFNRIFGLDRLAAQALRTWKEDKEDKTRKEIMDSRKRLLDTWADSNSEGGTDDNGGKQ